MVSTDPEALPRPLFSRQALADIRLVVFDVDGVLTDGRLYYGAEGEVLKQFNVKDGVGIKLLKHFGLAVAVISAKDSAPLKRRIKDLGIEHFFPKTRDKWAALSQIKTELNVADTQIAYVGDDIIDLQVMLKIGLAICPSDAYGLVRERSHWVTQAAGGQGVAREVADALLQARMPLEQAYRQALLPKFEKTR